MQLTETELHKLSDLEAVIEKGQKTFVEVGLALAEIKERRLYRRDFQTFEAYCHSRWGWTGRRANQLANAALVVQGLPQDLGTAVPTERVAREVAKLPPERREEVVRQVAAAGPVTGPAIAKHGPPPSRPPVPTRPVPTRPAPPAEPPAVLDGIGRPIPAHLVELWDRGAEVQEYLTAISRLRGTLRAAGEAGDLLWADTNTTHALSHLDQAYTTIKNAIPHTLCTSCQGADPKVSKSCMLCKGRGLISEFKWDRAVPKETKDLILKTIPKH
jgi:hypothetical protein